ncbi:MAG: bacterial Ig-like domain-containing protein [Clostridia bacterium]|nr:bacterial Ig-like domain-containing protein [Clostridia bacterium]
MNKTKIVLIVLVAVLVVALIATAIAIVVANNQAEQQGTNISKIYVSSWPTKLQYYVGEQADFSGLAIQVVRTNGKTTTVTYSEETKQHFSFAGFDSSKPTQEQTVTIFYKGATCKLYVAIKEVPKPAPVLVAISIDVMPKTEYKVGEWLNTSGGMLLKHYNDGTTVRTIIINSYISGWQEAYDSGVGTYTLTITFKENGVVQKTTYDITISE